MKEGRHFIFVMGSYPFSLLVSIGQSDEQRLKLIRRYFPDEKINDEYKLDTVANSVLFDSCDGMIALSKMPDEPVMKGFLAHEIWHIVDEMFKKIDIGLHSSSTEAYAYQISYLTTEIYKRLLWF